MTEWQTPVVFLTAWDAPEERMRGLHVGGDDYITKPFSLDELLARIEAILLGGCRGRPVAA